MLFITLLMLINISILPNVSCQTVDKSLAYEVPAQSVRRGETLMINGGKEANKVAQKSLKWRFNTDPGDVLSFKIVEDHFKLSSSDCVVGNVVDKNVPVVEVTVFPNDSMERVFRGCTNRPIQPSISSNSIEVLYRNIQSDGDFVFAITAKFSGYLLPNAVEENFHVPSRKFPQWIALRKDARNTHFRIIFKNLEIKKSKKAVNCKTAYLNVYDDKKEPLLNICNHDDSYKKEQEIVIPASTVNITFKKATFKIVAHSLNYTYPTLTTTAKITFTQKESNTTQQMLAAADESSGIYLIIGLVLAAVLVLVSVVFVIRKLRKHHRPYHNRRESNKPPDSEVNTYTSGTTLSLPPYQSQAINNVMYERIVKGTQNPVAPQGTATNNGSQSHATPLNPVDKRLQRLSQLADKYIDIEIPSRSAETNAKKMVVCDQSQSRSVLPRKTSRVDPSEAIAATSSFHYVRPPIPLPCSSPKKTDYATTYESFDPQLTESDLASPAYATINDATQEPNSERKFVFPSDKGIPVGEYSTSGEVQQITKGLPKATYISTESLIEDADKSQSWQQSSSQAEVTVSNDEDPMVGKDGYLSITPLDNNELSNQILDTKNSFTEISLLKGNLQCQGYGLPPVSELENIASSMPNLLSEDPVDVKKVGMTPPKIVPRKKFVNKATHNTPENTSQQPTNRKNSDGQLIQASRYKHPRPSVPDIFLQCAYTSGDDITQIRSRLQRLADEAHKNNSLGGASPPESPASAEGFLYDSPRPSLCTSGDFYDTPRPSLPNIYPGEMQQLLKNTRMKKQS